jgi:hypothetical protein
MYFDDHIDLTRHEIRNAVLQLLAANPSSPTEGHIFGNSATHRPQYFDGTSFKAILLAGDVTSNTGDVTQGSASGSVGRMKVSAAADKSIQDYTGGAGIVKSDANGVVTPAVAGTDYLTGSSTNTLTNKTIDATGTGNTISNLGTSNFAASAINSSGTLTGASNTQFPTALAVKTYADNLLAVNDAQVLKGGIDASTNPNFPAADAGWTYRITVAGLIGGASGTAVQVGDTITCFVDSTASGTLAAVGANWAVTQANVDQATTVVQGLSRYATNAEALAKAVSTAAVTPAALVGFSQVKAFTFGDGSAVSFTLNHNLNTFDVITQVRDASTNEVRYPKIVNATANTVTISGYLTAPASNAMKAVVQG